MRLSEFQDSDDRLGHHALLNHGKRRQFELGSRRDVRAAAEAIIIYVGRCWLRAVIIVDGVDA